MTDVVKLYNPANASALTSQQIADMQNLTSDEIRQLAQAYPNAASTSAYLLIVDMRKEPAKQIPTLSSWESLFNLRERNGRREFVAFSFRGVYQPRAIPATRFVPKKIQVIDLSDTELMSLPGFKLPDKTIGPQDVEIKKVNRTYANPH